MNKLIAPAILLVSLAFAIIVYYNSTGDRYEIDSYNNPIEGETNIDDLLAGVVSTTVETSNSQIKK